MVLSLHGQRTMSPKPGSESIKDRSPLSLSVAFAAFHALQWASQRCASPELSRESVDLATMSALLAIPVVPDCNSRAKVQYIYVFSPIKNLPPATLPSSARARYDFSHPPIGNEALPFNFYRFTSTHSIPDRAGSVFMFQNTALAFVSQM
jgi:hypothetical protein